MIQNNLMKGIENPEDEYQREFERKQKLRIKARQKYNEVSANFKTVTQTEPFKYIICSGNNSDVVSMCMRRRKNWEETSYYNTIFNFKWQPTSKGIMFELVSRNGQKQMVNHFEHHSVITTKDNLFRSLQKYCEADVFDYVPITFLIESNSETYKQDLDRFKSVFNICKQYDDKSLDGDDHDARMYEMNKKINGLCLFSTKSGKSTLNIQMPNSHFDGYNIWFLKCTQFNRGKGIYVFNTLEQLVSLINEIDKGLVISEANELISNIKLDLKKKLTKEQFNSADICLPKVKSSTFVIQKYIERPLLINKRKFDIRVWILLTQELKVYFFKEGYLRTSSETFSLSEDSITKQFVHLTNNAVQINSENYGKFEDGNQMSFKEFQDYINLHYGVASISVNDHIITQMKNIVITTFMSAKEYFSKDNKN